MPPRSYATYVGGDYASAARDVAESLRLFRQAGDLMQVGAMLGNLGNYELPAGDLDAAHRHLAESLDIARAFNARSNIVYETFNLGLAEYLGRLSPDAAGALFAESLDLTRRTGMRAASAYALLGLAIAGRSGADPGLRCAGCTARPTRPLRIWATPPSRWKAGWPTATASGCVPRWAPGRSRPNTPAGRALDVARVLAAL